MRLVLDTNVIFSSLVFKGKTSFEVFTSILLQDVFYSDFIINEINSKKSHKKFEGVEEAIDFSISLIKDWFTYVEIKHASLPDVCRDKDDNHILQLCDEIEADYLITGDQDLLILSSYKNTVIISPANFLKLL